ncbi:MAG: DUF4825 domain-containing protein [Evtepia sp.]
MRQLLLWRNTIDGDCHRRTLTFQDQRIETRPADAAAYVSVGRADDLYQLRTPYVGNNVAVANVVGSFQLNEVLGPYTIELQTSQEPYGILLHLEQDLTSETARRYLEEMSSLILALIDNAGYVAYTTPSEPTPQDTGAITKDANPKMNQPDPEAFRLLYATHFTRMEPYYPGKLTGDCYPVKDLLYFNATLVEKPQATVAETKAYYENFKLVWSGGYLAVRWADGSGAGTVRLIETPRWKMAPPCRRSSGPSAASGLTCMTKRLMPAGVLSASRRTKTPVIAAI